MAEMCGLAARHSRGLRTETPLPGVTLFESFATSTHQPVVYEPMLCLVLQGAKAVTVGARKLRYDPACYAIASVEMPATSGVIEASPERPYRAVSLSLDREVLASLLPELPGGGPAEPTAPGFNVSPVTQDLADAWLRLLRLLDRPQDIAVLAPMLQREILYRLLQGPQAAMLRQIAAADSRLSQVRRAIAWIRDHYGEPLRVEALAHLAGMSPATFHRHFKAATSLSPLQYQKNLRLQHARRLLITDHDAARAAYAVGYESPSQFSREYARLFGAPPARDAQRLRGDVNAMAAAGA